MAIPTNIAAALADLKTYIEGLQDPFAATNLGQTYALWEIAANGTGGGGGGGGGGSTITRAQAEHTEPQLTAPGTTASRSFAGYALATIQVDVANINTSVTLRIEGSNNGTTWFNMSTSETDTVLTANATKAFQFESCPEFVRVNFVSEVGGTSATIDAILRFSA